MDGSPTHGIHGRKRRSRRFVLIWLGVAFACEILVKVDQLSRDREAVRVSAFTIEQQRRDAVDFHFRYAAFAVADNRSPEFCRQVFGSFGTLTMQPINGAGTGLDIHVRNDSTGDVMHAVITDKLSNASVVFAGAISLHSMGWLVYTTACWWVALVVPAFLLGGLLAFFVPPPNLHWILSLAIFAAIASTVGPDPSKPRMMTLWSIAPLATLPIACIGAIFSSIWRSEARLQRLRTHCRKCGYNLTGNVSGVCPECGVGWNRVDFDTLASNLEIIE